MSQSLHGSKAQIRRSHTPFLKQSKYINPTFPDCHRVKQARKQITSKTITVKHSIENEKTGHRWEEDICNAYPSQQRTYVRTVM